MKVRFRKGLVQAKGSVWESSRVMLHLWEADYLWTFLLGGELGWDIWHGQLYPDFVWSLPSSAQI